MNSLQLFREQMIEINEESNKKMTALISNVIEQEVSKTFKEKYNQHIQEIIEDRLEKFEYTQEKEFQNVHDRINQAGEYMVDFKRDTEEKFENSNNRIDNVEGKTNTLEFNGRSDELRRYIHSKIYKSTGINQGTLEDTLFFGNLNRELQGRIKKKYNITRYGLLLEEELDDCKSLIDSWFPPSNYKGRYMQEYRKRKDKGSLPCSLEKAYNEYLNKNEGII